MFCKNCGNAIEEGAAFCPKCGTSVNEAPAAAPAAPAAPVKKKKKLPVIIAAVVAVFVLLGVLGGGDSGSSSGGSSNKLPQEVQMLVGDWQMVGAISDGEAINSSNGDLTVYKDGSVKMRVVDVEETFDRWQFVEINDDGDYVYNLYKGSEYVRALRYISESGRETLMIIFDSTFAVVYRR